MTPTAADLLNGCILTLATPPRLEDAGVFATARVRTVALINKLVAIECADGAAVRIWENAALRSLIAEAAPKYAVLSGLAVETGDGDYSLAALDAANANLRQLLINLHEVVELSRDIELDRRILRLYREIARRRELYLPPVKPFA
jgi:hypothetical protein